MPRVRDPEAALPLLAIALLCLLVTPGLTLGGEAAPPQPTGQEKPESAAEGVAPTLTEPACGSQLRSDVLPAEPLPAAGSCADTVRQISEPLAKGPPFRQRYCRCSCGVPCESSADCGGASCDRFITCC